MFPRSLLESRPPFREESKINTLRENESHVGAAVISALALVRFALDTQNVSILL